MAIPATILRQFRKHWKYMVFLLVFSVLSFEGLSHFFLKDKYPIFSEVYKLRYSLNGVPTRFPPTYARSDYYGYRHQKNLDVEYADNRYGFAHGVVTDSVGFRSHGDIRGAPSIMILGDSVTFGVGVENDESYPAQLQALFLGEYNVRNLGVGGWGPAEYHLAYQRHAAQMAAKLVIVGLFLGNDFANLQHSHWTGRAEGRMPHPPLLRSDIYADDEGHLRARDYLYRIPVLRNSRTFVFLYRRLLGRVFPSVDQSREIDSEALTIELVNDIQNDYDREVLVVLLPAQYHYRGNFSIDGFRSRLEELGDGGHVLDLYPAIRANHEKLYVDGSHFNPDGNKVVAQTIYDYLISNNLIE